MKMNNFTKTLLVTSLLGGSLLTASEYIENLNEELSYNAKRISEYKNAISEIEKRSKYLEEIKAKNPKLYVKKPLYEENKSEYIYRIKLAGAEAKNLNFEIKNHRITLQMHLKTQRKDENAYYSSSRSFYQQFNIPKDVLEEKITNSVNGDYFEIIMPKKLK